MRHILFLSLCVFVSPAAWGQTVHTEQQPQQLSTSLPPQQISDNSYAGRVVYEPQDYVVQSQPRTPSPSDYGQSVMTDIRQMNF